MVQRPYSPFKTPPISRGSSPARSTNSIKSTPSKQNSKTASPSKNRNSRIGASPDRNRMRKPGSSPNVAQRAGFSPDRTVKRISPPPTRSQSERNLRSRGYSPQSRGTSRGSE